MVGSLAAMLSPWLLSYVTNFALTLNNGHQFTKDVMELPLVNQCDLGYVKEKRNEADMIQLLGLLPKRR